MRLGIDLDGVVADFNAGWMRLHTDDFGTALHPEMVTGWNGLHTLAGFEDMHEFWSWAQGRDDRPSIFRHLELFPHASEVLGRLAEDGHKIVIITAKPDWAVPDTLRWLADHRIPTREIHITERKHEVDCDVYLDDSPIVLPQLLAARPGAGVWRMVRPWNRPLEGAVDVADWPSVHALVTGR